MQRVMCSLIHVCLSSVGYGHAAEVWMWAEGAQHPVNLEMALVTKTADQVTITIDNSDIVCRLKGDTFIGTKSFGPGNVSVAVIKGVLRQSSMHGWIYTHHSDKEGDAAQTPFTAEKVRKLHEWVDHLELDKAK